MKETVFLMVRAVILTPFKNISDTIHELETESAFTVSDTKNIKVLETELLLTRVRNPKK